MTDTTKPAPLTDEELDTERRYAEAEDAGPRALVPRLLATLATRDHDIAQLRRWGKERNDELCAALATEKARADAEQAAQETLTKALHMSAGEAIRLRAEAKALREALEDIAGTADGRVGDAAAALVDCVRVAAAALAATPGKDDGT